MEFEELRALFPRHSAQTAEALSQLDFEQIDYDLLVDCVCMVATKAGRNAVDRAAVKFERGATGGGLVGEDGREDPSVEAEALVVEELEEERRVDITDGRALQGASEILEQKAIVRIVAKDSRRAFHVIDSASRGKSHTCLPGFCTCMAYCMTVASKPESLVCKHELANLLADALGMTEDSVKEEAEFARELDHRTTLPMTEYVAQQ